MQKRFEVTLTKGDETVRTFTWAETLEGANQRLAEGFAAEPDIWNGWTFEIKG